MKPLQGITVIDISRLLPGGFASLLLARQGARVIKVEEPGVGDYYRGLTGGKEFVDLGHFQEINAGKELITLNLKSESGRQIFQRLLKKADILIENFRPGTLKRLGIPYSVLSRWNPRLILCSITGGGQTGEGSRLGGHDLNYLALSGLLSLIRNSKGAPVVPDFQMVDLATGYRSVFLITSALQQRSRTRRGSWIHSSMQDAGIEMARLYGTSQPSRTKRKPTNPLEGSLPNYRIYRTKDGKYVAFAALEPKFIQNFGRAMGDPKRIQTLHLRGLTRLFLSRTFREWTRLGKKYDFCLSPVLTVEEACGSIGGGKLPPMGKDNTRVLKSLGYKKAEIRRWAQDGVL